MKFFVVSDRSAVECASTETEGWLSRFGAGAGIWREDSAGMFVAPDGQKVHAGSIRKAYTQWRDANRGNSSGTAPGRMRASASAATFDEAGAKEIYARRAKAFEAANVTPADLVNKGAGVSTLFHDAPAASDFARRREIFNGANQ